MLRGLLLGIFAVSTSALDFEAAASSSFDVLKWLDTKTPYSPQQDENTYARPPSTCTLRQIQHFGRHGSRYSADLEDLVALNEILDDSAAKGLIKEPYSWLASWDPIITAETGSENLHSRGQAELFGIGMRLKNRYAALFDMANYTPQEFIFRSTESARVMMSAQAFAFGLFHGEGDVSTCGYQPVWIFNEPQEEDHFKIDMSCPKWIEEVDLSPHRDVEEEKYEDSNLPPIAERLAELTGVPFTKKVVKYVYDACAEEASLWGIHDKMCSLLTPEDFDVMNTVDDLGDWYKRSYGTELNLEVAAPIVQDMVFSMENNHTLRGHFRFGHSTGVSTLLTALGLYKDEFELTADVDPVMLASRQYKTRTMATMANNVIFEVFDCLPDETLGADVTVEKGNVTVLRMFHNEREVVLPGCDLFCPLSTFKKLYDDLFEVEYPALCNIEPACAEANAQVNSKINVKAQDQSTDGNNDSNDDDDSRVLNGVVIGAVAVVGMAMALAMVFSYVKHTVRARKQIVQDNGKDEADYTRILLQDA